MKLLHTCAEESSVHGLARLVEENRHWTERLLWAIILIFSIYCSYGVCLTTWTRYQESPTVLTLETDYRRWIYRRPAVTVCPMHIDENRLKEMVYRIWSIEDQDEKFHYYSQYLITITNVTFNNLRSFEPFQRDSSLTNVNMLEVARNVKFEFMPTSDYLPVLTEMGVCFSNSNLSYVQSVSDMINYKNRTWLDSCYSFDLCKSSVRMSAYGKIKIFLFVHSEDEVMMATDIINLEMKETEQVEMVLWVDQIVSSTNLKYLSPARRKCVYPHETTSYYKLHTPNLCKINCRIRKALQACSCVPFFYNIDQVKKCDASGMVCLSKKFNEWYYANCTCMELCESTKYTLTSFKVMHFQQLNSQVSMELFFPKRRIKRSVLFSLSDLIVSFGGAAALFLGCSFLSGIEFIYFFLEYVAIYICRVWKMQFSDR